MKFLVALSLVAIAHCCMYDNIYSDNFKRAVAWDYGTDANGPSNWGTLSPAYATCGTGTTQSPVQIRDFGTAGDNVESYDIGEINTFSGDTTVAQEQNNGHNVVVYGSGYITGGPLPFGDEYPLVQFHWHTPSEHTLNGVRFPMEMHMVHTNVHSGDTAVIGIFIDIGDQNDWLEEFFAVLPAEVGSVNVTDFNSYGSLPTSGSYYHYMGSLTTPPCTEYVRWLVLDTPVSASQVQIDQFQQVYAFNQRPDQPLNGRMIYHNEPTEVVVCEECQETVVDGTTPTSVQTQINFNFAGMIPNMN